MGEYNAGSTPIGVVGVDINGVPTPAGTPSTTGATTSVSGSASAGTLLAANTARKGATIVNDSTEILYVLLGAGTVSATVYTVALQPTGTVGAYYEVPFGFNGIITGIWASATGSARITELT